MLKNGRISLPDKQPIDFFNTDGSSVIKEYQVQAYEKNLGGRKRHREVLNLNEEFGGRETSNRYTDKAVKKMVSRLKSPSSS